MANLFTLTGRIGRKDYIIITLAIIAVGLVLSGLTGFNDPPVWVSIIETVVALALGIPNGFKRLHDTNKSGWWLLIGFIPIVGWIAIIVLTWILPGDPGENQYGLPNEGTPFPELHKA